MKFEFARLVFLAFQFTVHPRCKGEEPLYAKRLRLTNMHTWHITGSNSTRQNRRDRHVVSDQNAGFVWVFPAPCPTIHITYTDVCLLVKAEPYRSRIAQPSTHISMIVFLLFERWWGTALHDHDKYPLNIHIS